MSFETLKTNIAFRAAYGTCNVVLLAALDIIQCRRLVAEIRITLQNKEQNGVKFGPPKLSIKECNCVYNHGCDDENNVLQGKFNTIMYQ